MPSGQRRLSFLASNMLRLIERWRKPGSRWFSTKPQKLRMRIDRLRNKPKLLRPLADVKKMLYKEHRNIDKYHEDVEPYNAEIIPEQLQRERCKKSRYTKEELKSKLLDYHQPPGPIPMVKSLENISDPKKALKVFYDVEKLGYKHFHPTYFTIVCKLCRAGLFSEVEKIVSHIRANDAHIKENLLCALILFYADAGMVERAIEIFHAISRFNCTRTTRSFNILMKILADKGMILEAREVFECHSKLGIVPGLAGICILAKAECDSDRPDLARQVFGKMFDKHIQLPTPCYNVLVGYYSKHGLFEKAMDVLEEMRKDDVLPDVNTYNHLVGCLCDSGNLDDAEKLIFDMPYRGCSPNVRTYVVLLNSFCDVERLDDALRVLSQMMWRKGPHTCKPDLECFHIVLRFLCRHARMDEASRFLVRMKRDGFEPNAMSYWIVVEGYSRAGDFDRMLNTVRFMLGRRFAVGGDSWSSLVSGLCKQDKAVDALWALNEMGKRSFAPRHETWEALLAYLCRSKKFKMTSQDALDDLVSNAA